MSTMPDTFPPPPRHVRLRPHARSRILLFRLATLPFIAASIPLLSMMLEGPLVRMFGIDVVGRINEVTPHQKNNDGRHFDLTYSYDRGDRIRVVGYGLVDTKGGPPPAVGQSVPLRTLTIGSFHHAELIGSGSGGYLCIGMFAFVWCGVVSLFAVSVWLGPVAERRFVTAGQCTAGVVAGKARRPVGRGTAFEISYTYRSADGTERTGLARATLDVFNGLQDGQQVIVLYQQDRPATSMLYEASNYEIVKDA